MATEVLPGRCAVEAFKSRKGPPMPPFQDKEKGAALRLGEVSVTEAHNRRSGKRVKGYGTCVGRDLGHALAMAVEDAAMESKVEMARLGRFVERRGAEAADVDR